jgi:hypothetical protein
MATIDSYASDATIDPADKLIGTDGSVGVDAGKTKNFTVSNLSTYILNQQSSSSSSSGTTNNVPIFSTNGWIDSVVKQGSLNNIDIGTIPTKGAGTAIDPNWVDDLQVEGTITATSKMSIGPSRSLDNQQFDLNLLRQSAKIAFGDNNTFGNPNIAEPIITWNVVVGEYGTTDTDQLQLHSKSGTFFTTGALGTTISAVLDVNGNFGINKSTGLTNKLEVVGSALIDGHINATGDIVLQNSTSAIYMKSPDGTLYKVQMANGGTLTVTTA